MSSASKRKHSSGNGDERKRGRSYKQGPQRERASSAYKQAAPLKPETKYFDCGINAAVTADGTTWADTEVPCANYVTSNGTTSAYTDSCLIPTANGSGYGQVDGSRFMMKRIRVRGVLRHANTNNVLEAQHSNLVRLVLVMDTQANGVQAQGEDVMQDYGAVPENQFSYQRIAGTAVNRFRVLKDETFVLQADVMGDYNATEAQSIAYRDHFFNFMYQPKKPLQISIATGNATPTVAGALSHNIFLLAFSSRGGAATTIRVQAATRCYYCD